MLANFNSLWGSGEESTIYHEHQIEGDRRRQKGLPRLILFASALDPRTKALLCFLPVDRDIIYKELEQYILQLADLRDPMYVANEDQPLPNAAAFVSNHAVAIADDDDNYGPFFSSLIPDNNQQEEDNLGDNDDVLAQQRLTHRAFERNVAISRELGQWKDEQTLPRILQLPDGTKKLSDPLKWWSTKIDKYHYLSQVAQRLLCIPATSASAERAFSSAGLTIAADRCNLLPELADELVFLHDAYRLTAEMMQA